MTEILELDVRCARAHSAKISRNTSRDGGTRGQVRVILLGPDAQDEGRVGAAHANAGVTSSSEPPGTAAAARSRHGEGRDHRRPATSRQTGSSPRRELRRAAWTWTRR